MQGNTNLARTILGRWAGPAPAGPAFRLGPELTQGTVYYRWGPDTPWEGTVN